MLERSSLQPDALIAQLQAQVVQLQQQNSELRSRLQTCEQSQSSLGATASASAPKHRLLEATAAVANALLTISTRRSFAPEELELAQALAHQVTLALQLIQLAEEAQRSAAIAREQEQAAQERAAELAKANEALRGTTARLANEPSLNAFLGHVISEACGQLRCDAGAIFLYDAASEQLSMTVSVGLENNFPYSEQILMPTASYPGWSLLLQTRKPLFLHPDLNPELFTKGTAEWHRAQGHHGILVTALMLGDRPLGQIAVAFRHKHRFKETDLELFQALAQQATLAVQLMQLAEEAKQAAIAREQEKAAQQRVAELVKANAAVQNCTAQLAGQLNPESFINHVLLEAAAQVDAYSAALFIYHDAETASMQAFVQNGQVQSIATHPDLTLFRPPVPRDDVPLWDLALSRNQAVFFNVEDKTSGIWLEWHRSQGHQSIVRVPLPLGSHLLGFISFCFREARSHLPANIELVLTLAQQATVALHLAQLAEANRRAVLTEERNRIAREIHDTLAQTFIGIAIQIGIAQRLITTSPSDTQQILDRVVRLAQTGLAEARSSVWALHPTADEYADLLHKLPLCVQQLTDGLPIQAEVLIAGTPCSVSAIVGQNLLRIAQAAVSNAIHHANATTLHVRLSYEATRLELSIQDNGCGFDPGIENGGFGLMSMSHRTARLNGQLTIDSQLGQGTEIRVEVPLEQGQVQH